jgi:hypothetical protein
MRKLIYKAGLMFFVLGLATDMFSQDKVKLYDPALDGIKQILLL